MAPRPAAINHELAHLTAEVRQLLTDADSLRNMELSDRQKKLFHGLAGALINRIEAYGTKAKEHEPKAAKSIDATLAELKKPVAKLIAEFIG